VCVFCARRHRDRRSSGSVDREMMWVWCGCGWGWMDGSHGNSSDYTVYRLYRSVIV
jgi:hypothetical protein